MKPTDEMLLPCPFCGADVMFRKALDISDGGVDAIVHKQPTNCGLVWCDGSTDESIIGAWNSRAALTAALADVPDNPAGPFAVGDRVLKTGTGYGGPGFVRAVSTLPDGTWRINVGHKIEGGWGEFQHIYSPTQLIRATGHGAEGIEPPGCPTPGACSCPGGERELAKRLGAAQERVRALEADHSASAEGGADHAIERLAQLNENEAYNEYTDRDQCCVLLKRNAAALRKLAASEAALKAEIARLGAKDGAADGWLPIETAPRDGSDILVHLFGNTYAVVFYDDESPNDFIWKTADGTGYRAGAPTHWQPPPLPPNAKSAPPTG